MIEDITLDKIIGHEKAKKSLTRFLNVYVKNKDGFKKFNTRPPGGVLLYGSPGVGKTMLIKGCYNETIKDNPDFRYKEIKVSNLSGGNITGESEKKIFRLFDSIRNSDKDWVLVFDEIDAICPDRRTTKAVCTIERTNALLSCLDGVNGRIDNVFIIATTNRKTMIDGAILRSGRFDDVIELGLPNLDESKQLSKKYLNGLTFFEDDFDDITVLIGEYGFGENWAGAEYDNLRTKLVAEYFDEINNKNHISTNRICEIATEIKGSYNRDSEGKFAKKQRD